MEREFRRITWSHQYPHNTGRARGCPDCHADPKTLGLGYGTLTYLGGDRWRFTPAEAPAELLGLDHGLSQVVTLSGKPLVHFRPGVRAFGAEDLRRILKVGLCLPCHRDFSDPVMRNWPPRRPCPVFPLRSGPRNLDSISKN